MYDITLIGTYHSAEGRCNEGELYSILESILPVVIFEEVPRSYYDAYYVQRSRGHNLEHTVISRYSETHNTPHIPVDSDDVPPESFFSEHKKMIGRVRGRANRYGYDYRSLSDYSYRCMYERGFHYLNSNQFTRHNEELSAILECALKEMREERLLEFQREYNDVIEKRENEMLANIYRYSSDHSYDRAVFLVGAGHRKSIIQKIQRYDGGVRVNWKY